MTLSAGMRLGPYEILGLVGAGGMGEVYRARDTRLGRDVAVKVLPADCSRSPERLRRFEQEARLTGALGHPNLLTLFDVGTHAGSPFIVTELLEGRSLRDALRGPLPPRKAVDYAQQIARGLAAAHDKNVVHRDLKPANLFLTNDGRVKILDFGLAKLVQLDSEAVAGSAVTTDTAEGSVVGTLGYMAPEQVRGKPADARSDIFAFGAVLYEMLSGQRAFRGDTAADAATAILTKDVDDLSRGGLAVPAIIDRICRRCLEKNPEERFQSARDVAFALEAESGTTGSGAATTAVAPPRRWRIGLAAAGVVILAALAAILWHQQSAEFPAPTVVPLTSAQRVGTGSFSPDGTQIAFASAGDDGANWDIWLKIVGETEARRLTTDPASERNPAWSPDGKQIAFLRLAGVGGPRSGTDHSAGTVCIVSPLGGPARPLSDLPARGQLSWSPDGRWLAAAKSRVGSSPPGGIHLIPATGGTPRELTSPKPPAFDVGPTFSPDGRRLAYASCEGAEFAAACDVYLLPLDAEIQPRGTARRLTRQGSWSQGLAWTRDGQWIVYGRADDAHLWRISADGGAAPQRVELAGRGDSPSAAATRDRLAFHRGYWHVGIQRLRLGGSPTPLIESALEVAEYEAQYSPDGRRITLSSNRGTEGYEVWLADAEGANLTRLTRGPGRSQSGPRWSPDGRAIAFTSQDEDGGTGIWTVGVDGSGLRQVTRDPTEHATPSWSHDGGSLYFTSTRTGRREVFRIPVAGGPEQQVTHEGGCTPHESRDGRTLYYMKVDSDGPLLARPTAGGPERTILPCISEWSYAVGPEGVFHVDCGNPDAPAASRRILRHWNASTGEDRPVAAFDADFVAGLSASPDGRTILYGLSPWGTGDLLMIENFR